jgi:hypothetical protein
MSKLTVANLFDAVRTLQNVHAFDVQRAGPSAEHSEPAERRKSTEGRSPAAAFDGAELSLAIIQAFDPKHDRFVTAHSRFRLRPTVGERLTRIDRDHGIPSVGTLPGSGSALTDVSLPFAEGALGTALGMAQARDISGQQHWIVIVLDSDAVSAALDLGEFEGLLATRRVLAIWADDDPGPSSRVPFLSERIALLTGLTQIGPVDGLDARELSLVLEALKNFEQAALLHLRLRPPTAERHLAGAAPRPSAASTRGETKGSNGNKRTADGNDVMRRLDHAHGLAPAMHEVLRAVAERAERHSKVVAVNLLAADAFQANGRPLPEWLLRPPSSATIAWYEGLVTGGCRPVLLLDRGDCPGLQRFLLYDAWQRRLPLTIVNCAGRESTTSEANLEARRQRERHGWPLFPTELPIMTPATSNDLDWMLDLAAKQATPVLVMVPARLTAPGPSVFSSPPPPVFGEGQLICEGSDVALLAWGAAVEVARRAAFELARAGIEASVINPVFTRPLDEGLIASVARRVRRTFVIEDRSLPPDLLLEILRVLSDGSDTLPFTRLGLNRDAAAEDEDELVSRLVGRCRESLTAPPAPERPIEGTSSAVSIQPLPPAQPERAAVSACPLSTDVLRWIEGYGAVGKRNLYLWRWARLGAELTTLPCVAPELIAPVCDTKVLSIMLCVLLDDVADTHGRGEFLDLLIRVACDLRAEDFSELPDAERRCAEVVCELSREYEQRVRSYPRFDEFEELLRYDASQFANTLRYSHLLNRHTAYLNLAEHDLYLPHNMHMMSFATLDLMCTADFPREHLGNVREATWHGQCMGRIGNLLSTWRRELRQNDLTSGIFARALATGDLSAEQVAAQDAEQIEGALRGGKHQFYFIRRWQQHRECMEAAIARVRGVDLRPLLAGHDRFFQMHVASQGLI